VKNVLKHAEYVLTNVSKWLLKSARVKMNRLLIIVFAFFYLCVSTGGSLHLHYCMGKLIDISLFETGKAHSEIKECSKCGMQQQSQGNGCCKDVHTIIKSETDQALISSIVSPGFSLVLLALTEYHPLNYLTIQLTDNNLFSLPNGPPKGLGIRLHILKCVFLI